MMGENVIDEQKISRAQYGDLVADCGLSAINTAIGPFLLGAIGIPVSLKYLQRFLPTSYEVKICASIFGAIGIAVYTTKKVRINCEKKIEEKYKI